MLYMLVLFFNEKITVDQVQGESDLLKDKKRKLGDICPFIRVLLLTWIVGLSWSSTHRVDLIHKIVLRKADRKTKLMA